MQSHPAGKSAAPGPQGPLPIPDHRYRRLEGPLPAAIAFVGCCLFALGMPTIPDHGYQFYVAARVLDGARLYVDVAAAEAHPPLITWIAMALEALGRMVGIRALTLFPIVVCAASAASLYAVWRIGPRSGFVLAALVAALLSLVGPHFGQGEHLALILALPYLFASAASVSSGARQFPLATRVGLAIAAGIGLSLKPHFALVWLGVEVYLATIRGIKSLVRAESVIILSIFVLYVVLTALITPDYFTILRWVLPLYARFAPVPVQYLILDKRTLVFIAGLAAGWVARRDVEWRRLSDVLSIASAAMYVTMLIEAKGFGYHWYPVIALSIALFALALRPYVARVPLLIPAIAVASIIWMNVQVERTTQLLVKPPGFLPEMVAVTDRYAKGGSILALSHTLAVAFPLVNLTGVRWDSPYGHLWMIPAIYQDSLGEQGHWRWLEKQMLDRLWNEIQTNDPGLIIVQNNMMPYFQQDPRFRDRFARSRMLGTVGFYILLGRPR
jgi:hypothetical protein